MKKTVGVISSRLSMAEFYAGILRELCSDFIEVISCSVEDESIRKLPQCDLYVSSITSYDMMLDSWVRSYLPAQSQIVSMDVSFSKAAVDLLHTYPEGTKALLVNQNKHMTMECIAQLYHLGISNIEFYPCYPGIREVPAGDLVFTVGEPDLVPAGHGRVVDIGSRWPSVSTLSEVALKLGNSFFLESDRFRRYQAKLAGVDYSLLKITSDSLTAENKLEIILNSLDEGIVCIDETNRVTLINRRARELLDVSRSDVINRKVNRALPVLPFDQILKHGAAAAGPFLINVHGRDLGVTVSPIRIQDQFVGAFATLQEFHTSEKQQLALRQQKTHKGFKAKYYFRDIIGSSPEISRVRDIARRMSSKDARILIEGESGTGKATLAQAIHNASLRANGAFVRVSCASLRDDLFEAELFGYAEGYGGNTAGRIGLIEHAHKGTLFLDSVDSLTPRQQASLLKFLQDGEIIRLGSDDPVPVDVRVISATAANMQLLLQNGSFRKDLYYRLNVVQLRIPTLWERRADVAQLIDYFIMKADARFELTGRARLALLQHRWEGNLRELQNCIEYLKYTGLHMVDLEDLPEVIRETRSRTTLREDLEEQSGLKLREYWVMRELGEVYADGIGLGRQAIVQCCLTHGNALSEHDVREILKTLADKGLVSIRTGRSGSRLTEEGYLKYRQIANAEGI